MGLFGINKELQFEVYNHDEPPKIPTQEGEERSFIGEIGEGTLVNKEFMTFHWLSWCQETIFLLLYGLCYCYMEREICLLAPRLYFNWGFCFLIFTFPHFDQDLSVKVSLIKSQVFQLLWLFVPQCQEEPLLGVVSHVGGKVHRLET